MCHLQNDIDFLTDFYKKVEYESLLEVVYNNSEASHEISDSLISWIEIWLIAIPYETKNESVGRKSRNEMTTVSTEETEGRKRLLQIFCNMIMIRLQKLRSLPDNVSKSELEKFHKSWNSEI